MSVTIAIAWNTFLEAIREKALYLLGGSPHSSLLLHGSCPRSRSARDGVSPSIWG